MQWQNIHAPKVKPIFPCDSYASSYKRVVREQLQTCVRRLKVKQIQENPAENDMDSGG